MKQENTALVERHPSSLQGVQELAGVQIKTAADLAERIRQIQGQAFILSPMAAVAAIAPGYVVNPVVVVIDPSVDAESGAGAEVYHQSAIHKRAKRDGQWVPLEASLNKIGLLKILTAAGVNVYPTQRLDDGTRQHYWMMEAHGDVTDFDGRIRRLPPGPVEIDLRDGSPQIGGWTPEAWVEQEREADVRRAKLPKDEQWKVKAEAINGWTFERVLQARKFGLRLAAAKALNALARNLGVRQKYTLDELRAKPFVIFRASFVPDLTDPEVRRMVTAASLGARALMYPGSRPQEIAADAETVTHGHGDPAGTFAALAEPEPEKVDEMATSAPPEDAREVDLDAKLETTTPVFHVTKMRQKGEGAGAQYFAETAEGPTLFTADLGVARALNAARGKPSGLAIETEKVSVGGQAYRQVVSIEAGGMKL